MSLSYAIIGDGAVSRELRRHAASHPELHFVGVIVRDDDADPVGAPRLSLDEALDRVDLVVEAAGVGAVIEHGPIIVADGTDLLVTSVGAFADAGTRASVLESGPGRTYLTTGAIGGLDLLVAAGRSGGLDHIELTTRKTPGALVQASMPDAERARILAATTPTELFRGAPTEAIERFPASLNVAVALGLAVGDLDAVTVVLVADPDAVLTEHDIRAHGVSGEYCFTVRNEPSPEHPSSSGLTARALLAGLRRIAAPAGHFV